MTAAPLPEHAHPVRRLLAQVAAGLDEAAGLPLWSLAAAEASEVLRELFAVEARLAALKLALVAHADTPAVDVPAQDASTSMVAWLRVHAGLPPGRGKKLLCLAHGLEQHPATREALAAASVSADAAGVIVDAVDALPAGLDREVVAEGERFLLDQAADLDTAQLRKVGERLLAVLDPEGAEQRDAHALARLEEQAARECFAQLTHDESRGVTDVVARVPLLTGLKLGRQLEAELNLRRPDPIPLVNEHGIRIAAAERRGLAFAELVDHVPLKALPASGGCDPVVVVSMDLETLLGGLKSVVLDTGHRISPALARRLAARHGVIPAVLGTKSEVLDLGRKARLASKKQRLAMTIQQGGVCAEEHCEIPITWADAHHLIPWRNGGNTDLADLVMPCRKHHRMADHPDYTVTRLGPGKIRINRRV